MESISIQTAQNIEIEYDIASLWDRVAAALIDYALLFSFMFGMLWIAINLRLGWDWWYMFYILFLFAPYAFYDLAFEVFMDGQSPGKKIRRIKIVRIDGMQPALGNYLMRWLLRIIDISLVGGAVAMISILLGGKGQRLGDIAAGTTVVRLRERATLDDTILTALTENYTPAFPQVAALSDGDIGIIKEVLATGRTMGYEVANRLLAQMKDALQRKMNIRTEMPPLTFLQTVMRDYNAVTGKLA